MKQKKVNVMMLVGVLIAIVLLMGWLFLGTTLEEDADPVTAPISIEQNN